MLGFVMTRPSFFLFACLTLTVNAQTPWKEQGVVHVAQSPEAKVFDVPVSAVRMHRGFWTERRRLNTEVSIPTLYKEFEERGILNNFRRLAGKQVPRRGPLYTDSDVYKWMEAVAFEIQSGETRNQALLEESIRIVLAAQQEDGYLNTYYTLERASDRHSNMHHGHELYCLGHMIQAGIAYYRAIGKRDLMDAGIRYVRYLQGRFGREKQPLFDGHPEIELALIELYRTTGDKSFLEFAEYFLGSDARLKISRRDLTYLNTGKPFTTREEMEGHAVRAGYANAGATDYYLESGRKEYRDTLDKLWQDLTLRKMYITGGTGSRQSGEAFGEPYELPNQLAYTESCAAISNMMWNWRMLAATGDAKYTDVLERALYNGVNSGLSLSGSTYCYRNPLEMTGNPADKIRNPWYDTTCCPPNLERVLASLPGYLYGTSKDGLYVHLYHSSELNWKLVDGAPIRVQQETDYPWAGIVTLKVSPESSKEFTLHLRIPAWSRTTKVMVNGQAMQGVKPGTYLPVTRKWAAGDTVRLEFDLRVRHTRSDFRVRDNIGKVAVERGPLVYCMEGLDQLPGAFPANLALDLSGPNRVKAENRPDLLGGVVLVKHPGAMLEDAQDSLYAPLGETPARAKPIEIRLVPYYTFANREPTPMQVWIPFVDAVRATTKAAAPQGRR